MSPVKTRLVPFAAIGSIVFALAGCTSQGGSSDDQMARFLVAPGKYMLYTCDEIARQAKASAARQKELEQLMVKAGADASGQVIGAVAYRAEYLSLRGDINELRNATAEKNCNPGRASDNAIR